MDTYPQAELEKPVRTMRPVFQVMVWNQFAICFLDHTWHAFDAWFAESFLWVELLSQISVLWPAVARSIEIPVHHLPLYSSSYLHTPEWKTGAPGTHDSSSLWQSILWLLAAGVFWKLHVCRFHITLFFITAKFKIWNLTNKWFLEVFSRQKWGWEFVGFIYVIFIV